MTTVRCTKCGAPITIAVGEHFARCEYCDSMLFIDRSGVMFYYVLPFILNRDSAIATFKRWAAGPEKASDLETKGQIQNVDKIYFPVYMFKRDVNGNEVVVIKPAKATFLPGLHSLKIPAGDIRIFDASFNPGDARLENVDISMDQYMGTLPGDAKEQALVYFPIYLLTYIYNGVGYTAVIEGTTGAVHASNYPTRSEVPYQAVAAIGFAMSFVGIAGSLYTGSFALATLCGIGFMTSFTAGYLVAKLR